jgi:uncharacterized membrane protein
VLLAVRKALCLLVHVLALALGRLTCGEKSSIDMMASITLCSLGLLWLGFCEIKWDRLMPCI